MPFNILLLRHGLTLDKFLFGKQKQSSSLSSIGVNQLTLILHYIKLENIDVIFTSPTKRAKESALFVRNNLNHEIQLIEENSLKEIYFENFSSDLIRFTIKNRFDELSKNLRNFNNVLLVSHASFIKLFCFYLLTNTLENSNELFNFFKKSIRVGYASLIHLKSIDDNTNHSRYTIYKIVNVD